MRRILSACGLIAPLLLFACHGTSIRELSSVSPNGADVQADAASGQPPTGNIVAVNADGGNGIPYTGGAGVGSLLLLSGVRFFEPVAAELPICPGGQPRPTGEVAARVLSKNSPGLELKSSLEWDACGASPRLLTNDETEALVYSPVSASDPDSFQIAAYHGRLLQALPAGSQSPPTVEPGRHPEAWCSDADNEPARAQIYIRSAGDGKPVEARLMLWVPESNGASAERGLVPVFAGPFPVSRTKAANRVSYSAPGLALGIDSGLELEGTENRFAGQWRAMINQALVEGHLQCRILPR